jgi:tetratricopeptide (TPR) repeat protein
LDRWFYHALEGEIALAASDFPAARAAFSKGEPELKMTIIVSMTARSIFSNHWVRDGFARARAAEGDFTGAIEEYRKLLTPNRMSKWTAMLEPLYVLELARLLEETGDRRDARHEYERFLELWKNADPDLPELRRAREGVARIGER